MTYKNPIVLGTFILTMTGLISRIIGFFYRIYLSHLFGEEGMGIYQLLSPILSLSFALTCAGIQSAISKYVAESCNDKSGNSSIKILQTGTLLSLIVSLPLSYFLYQFSESIAKQLLFEPRTASLIKILSLSIPLSAIHSCVNGFYYGMKKTSIPAFTQLLEQLCRVGSVFLFHIYSEHNHHTMTIHIAVIGLVVGELFAVLVCFLFVHFYQPTKRHKFHIALFSFNKSTIKISTLLLSMAIPLSLNRIIINFLQSIETVQIPNQLLKYGYDTTTALSIYGVLTGMALPLIYFPSAFTNSMSVLLLPLISQAQSSSNQRLIKRAILKTIEFCSVLGFLCMVIFLLIGKYAGHILFKSHLAGHFIMTLSFICPFLYLNNTISSILNGLGKIGTVFIIHILSVLIRLAFVYITIPYYGITGYLWGLLISQIFDTSALMLCLVFKKTTHLFSK